MKSDLVECSEINVGSEVKYSLFKTSKLLQSI